MESVMTETRQYGPISPSPSASQIPLNPTSYAFLVHSQHTIPHNLSPNVDDQKLYRQRRRRTSPEDQVILETEFELNQKPDKLARKAIVDRLAGMGEKEVQIWFQNRRQNTRRRSRPLTPEEYAALMRSTPRDPTALRKDSSLPVNSQLLASHSKPNSSSYDPEHVSVTERSSQEDERVTGRADVAIRRDERGTRHLKRSLSGVRLSTSSEGAAQLLQDSEPSPSPTKPIATGMLPSVADDLRNPSIFSPIPARLPAGRSRNSRAWEFWCDADARTELEKKADQEQSGSATDAISLMRSSSSRSALKPVEIRDSPQPTAKRAKSGREDLLKPHLSRAHSSVARLRHRSSADFELHDESTDALKAQKSAIGLGFSPSGDSDKENFDPDGNIQSIAHRRSNPSLSKSSGERSNLPESRTAPVHRGSSLLKYKHHRSTQKSGAFNPEDDEELARFMGSGRTRGGQAAVGLSSEEDLDCVQGLLSLSQGWK